MMTSVHLNSQIRRYLNAGACGRHTWRMKGSEWGTLADPWLIAHDLFHHAPDDTGTLAEELSTLGAEFYLHHSRPGDPPAGYGLISSAAGIAGMPFDEGLACPELYELPGVSAAALTPAIELVFRDAAESASDCLKENVADDNDWREALACFEPGRIVSYLRLGYAQACARFPDRSRAQAAFLEAEEAVAIISMHARTGQELLAQRTGYAVHLQLL